MHPLERTAIEPTIRFGKACDRGTQRTVGEILEHLASGRPGQELLVDFPQRTHEEVQACFAWATARGRRIQIDPAA